MDIPSVMNSGVVRVRPETKVADALRVMMDHRIDGLPVVDDTNQVVGIITYADLLRRGRRHHPRAIDFLTFAVVIQDEEDGVRERFQRMLDEPVMSICTKNVITCHLDDDVVDVAGLMVDYRIKRVPVVSEGGVLVGIVSRDDLLHAIWRAYALPGTDKAGW